MNTANEVYEHPIEWICICYKALTMTIYRLSNSCYFRLTTKCDFAKCRFSSQGVQYSGTYHGISEFAVYRSTAKSFFT